MRQCVRCVGSDRQYTLSVYVKEFSIVRLTMSLRDFSD